MRARSVSRLFLGHVDVQPLDGAVFEAPHEPELGVDASAALGSDSPLEHPGDDLFFIDVDVLIDARFEVLEILDPVIDQFSEAGRAVVRPRVR